MTKLISFLFILCINCITLINAINITNMINATNMTNMINATNMTNMINKADIIYSINPMNVMTKNQTEPKWIVPFVISVSSICFISSFIFIISCTVYKCLKYFQFYGSCGCCRCCFKNYQYSEIKN